MDIQLSQTPTGAAFAMMGKGGRRPMPTLLVFAGDMQSSLREYSATARLLAGQGWIAVSLDLPCHGDDRRQDEPDGLWGWRARIEKREEIISDFCRRASTVLDYLAERGEADLERVAACGTSRGGFMALHLAALDPRVRRAAALAPVTDLLILQEFAGMEEDSTVRSLALRRSHTLSRLAERAIWMCIGNDDQRVGTDLCVGLARSIAKEALRRGLPANVDLHVLSYPGHTALHSDYEAAAEWLLAQS